MTAETRRAFVDADTKCSGSGSGSISGSGSGSGSGSLGGNFFNDSKKDKLRRRLRPASASATRSQLLGTSDSRDSFRSGADASDVADYHEQKQASFKSDFKSERESKAIDGGNRWDWGSVSTAKIGGSLSRGRIRPSTAMPLGRTHASVASGILGGGPSWLKHDRTVLRFYCYFREGVTESDIESYRVRRCTVFFFLADGDLEIREDKTDNSGIPQGKFLGKHKPEKEDGSHWVPTDFNVGVEFEIYSRKYHIYGCDPTTRQAMLQLYGVEVPRDEPVPADPYLDQYHKQRSLTRVPTRSRIINNDAVEMGRPSIIGKLRKDTLGQYLKGGRTVLRFYCMWDDTQSLYGEKRRFILHYFMADDTIEIRDPSKHERNCGRDPYPLLLKRQRLPRDYRQKAVEKYFGRNEDNFYVHEDLKCGTIIDVYGRKLILLSCDRETRLFYAKQVGYVQKDVHYFPPRPAPLKRVIAPYNGFGSEEDSLSNCLHLVPRKPKTDLPAFLKNQGRVLRFRARMVTDKPEDVDRQFVISYYMEDDTLSVFEPPQRNSGIIGGKFLERRRYKLPTKEREEDQEKKLSERTAFLVEELRTKIRQRMKGGRNQLLEAFKLFGGIGGGDDISLKEFQYGLLLIGMDININEASDLFDVYDKDGSKTLDYQEFIEGIMEDVHGKFGAAASRYASRWYRPSDLAEGKTVSFLMPETGAKSADFRVLAADGFTKNLMKSNPELFPASNVEYVAANLASALLKHGIKPGEVFKQLDPSGTGEITVKQFMQVIKKWCEDFELVDDGGLNDVELATLVSHYDEDNSGCINHVEFADALIAAPLWAHQMQGKDTKTTLMQSHELTLLKKLGAEDPLNIKMLFRAMDPDQDGHLPIEDFKRLLKFKEVELTDDEWDFFLKKYDPENDGVIDYDAMFEKAFVPESDVRRASVIAEAADPVQDYELIAQALKEKTDKRVIAMVHIKSFNSQCVLFPCFVFGAFAHVPKPSLCPARRVETSIFI